MEYFYERKESSVLTSSLTELIHNGVIVDRGYFFFKSFHNEGKKIDEKWIKEIYMDETGFECTVNSFHLADYCDQNFENFQQVANMGFEFIEKFQYYWCGEIKVPCIAIFSMSLDTEFGYDGVFRFHKKREQQYWVDPTNFEDSLDAVMTIEIL